MRQKAFSVGGEKAEIAKIKKRWKEKKYCGARINILARRGNQGA